MDTKIIGWLAFSMPSGVWALFFVVTSIPVCNFQSSEWCGLSTSLVGDERKETKNRVENIDYISKHFGTFL
jgi:hypothetical protein